MRTLTNSNEIDTLVKHNAMFFIGHSGGKDSQAMFSVLRARIPAAQIVVVHADLGDIEHDNVYDHIVDTIDGFTLLVAKAYHLGGKQADFFSLIRQRRDSLDTKGKYDAPAWPSSAARFCTSDLKTGPIWRTIRGFTDGGMKPYPIVVNCVGIRGQESAARAKKVIQRGTLNLNKKNTNSKRDAYDWWPIANWSEDDVWREIGGKQNAHPAYAAGNERLSCKFCIFGSDNDLRLAKQSSPELYQRYVELESEVRSTMFNGKSIKERAA